jgi:Arc/MetJ-type ribon-helix-helix transcriptional regulator
LRLSVSLPDEEVALLDEYVRTSGLASRSAAVQHAVRLLRHPDLEQDYAAAWEEWDTSREQSLWDGTAADGLINAAVKCA